MWQPRISLGSLALQRCHDVITWIILFCRMPTRLSSTPVSSAKDDGAVREFDHDKGKRLGVSCHPIIPKLHHSAGELAISWMTVCMHHKLTVLCNRRTVHSHDCTTTNACTIPVYWYYVPQCWCCAGCAFGKIVSCMQCTVRGCNDTSRSMLPRSSIVRRLRMTSIVHVPNTSDCNLSNNRKDDSQNRTWDFRGSRRF